MHPQSSMSVLSSLFAVLLFVLQITQAAARPDAKIRQATRDQVVRRYKNRASRASLPKRAEVSPMPRVPITCGSSQIFTLLYSRSNPVQDNKFALVQPDPKNYAEYGTGLISGAAVNQEDGARFKLDETCRLVIVGGEYDRYYFNSYKTDTSNKVFFDKPSYSDSGFPAAVCSIATDTYKLSCTNGPKNTFSFCPSPANGPTYITQGSKVPSDCYKLTLTAGLVDA